MLGQHTKARRRTGRLGVVIADVVVIGGALLALGLRGDVGNADATPTVATSEVAGVRPPSVVRATYAADEAPTPVSLKIPTIKVAADITSLDLNQDGTVEVPKDPAQAGWFERGPKPGESGSSVILGHRDSKQGPAVFYRLQELDRGDRIAVKLSDRSVAHYEVVQVTQYANEDFPAQKVYAGSNGRPALNLVTCGGKYDREAGGYQSNIVVYTTYLWATGRETRQ